MNSTLEAMPIRDYINTENIKIDKIYNDPTLSPEQKIKLLQFEEAQIRSSILPDINNGNTHEKYRMPIQQLLDTITIRIEQLRNPDRNPLVSFLRKVLGN